MFSRIGRGRVVHDLAVGVAIGQPGDRLPVPPVGDFLDREVKLVARDEVDDGLDLESSFGVDRHFGADQPDLEPLDWRP